MLHPSRRRRALRDETPRRCGRFRAAARARSGEIRGAPRQARWSRPLRESRTPQRVFHRKSQDRPTSRNLRRAGKCVPVRAPSKACAGLPQRAQTSCAPIPFQRILLAIRETGWRRRRWWLRSILLLPPENRARRAPRCHPVSGAAPLFVDSSQSCPRTSADKCAACFLPDHTWPTTRARALPQKILASDPAHLPQDPEEHARALDTLFADRVDHRPTRHGKLFTSHVCLSLRSLRSDTRHDNEDLADTKKAASFEAAFVVGSSLELGLDHELHDASGSCRALEVSIRTAWVRR